MKTNYIENQKIVKLKFDNREFQLIITDNVILLLDSRSVMIIIELKDYQNKSVIMKKIVRLQRDHFDYHENYIELASNVLEYLIFQENMSFICDCVLSHEGFLVWKHIPEYSTIVTKIYDEVDNKVYLLSDVGTTLKDGRSLILPENDETNRFFYIITKEN